MWSIATISTHVAITALALALGKVLYNVYLHPRRKYPGPWWWAATRLPWLAHSIRGDLHLVLAALHMQYGDQPIRIAPDELSYIHPSVWKQVYGHRDVEMPKNLQGAGLMPPMRGADSIVTAPRAQHARIRKALAPAFSERALREQESFLQRYVAQLIVRLGDKASEGPQNLVDWLNWTTFDVVGDLAFGAPFGCLDDSMSEAAASCQWVPYHGFAAKQHLGFHGICLIRLKMRPQKDTAMWWCCSAVHAHSGGFLVRGQRSSPELGMGQLFCLRLYPGLLRTRTGIHGTTSALFTTDVDQPQPKLGERTCGLTDNCQYYVTRR